MKKLVKIIIVLGIIAVAMFFTCPEEGEHVDKLTQEMVNSAQGDQNGGDTDLLEDLGNVIVGTISEKVVRLYVKSQLKVEDYKVLNVGKMYYDGEQRVVTIGAFGHVFCLVKAYDILDEMEK